MEITTNTAKHAKVELDILSSTATDPENRPLIEPFIPEILALCEKFGNTGQSGGSAPHTAQALSQAIKKLCLQESICPIQGTDNEWTDVSNIGDGSIKYQNKRCLGLFKDQNDKVTYVDAIIKRTENGHCWSGSFWLNKDDYLTGNKDLKIFGSQEIKGFPFEPKTFYIDVVEEEVAPEDWEMYLKNPKQLEEVWEYYKK